jgi:hypothetical protein
MAKNSKHLFHDDKLAVIKLIFSGLGWAQVDFRLKVS